MQKQNNSLIILLSVLLFISLIIAGFFAYQVQNLTKEIKKLRTEESVKQTPITTPDLTVNWKTYTNNDLKYSLKYPSNFRLIVESNNNVRLTNNLPPDPNCSGGGCNLEISRFSMYFDHFPDEDTLSLIQFANQRRNSFLNINKEQGNIESIKKYGYEMIYHDGIALGYNHNYYLRSSENINFAITSVFPSREDAANYIELEDQILSTFKFLDEDVPTISATDLKNGWYWGDVNQKKTNTPSDWVFKEAGRSSCWHKAGVLCQ